jgi:hypothetical protein
VRLSQPFVGTALSVAAAVVVTAQAMSAPRKPYKARDIVPVRQPAAFADVCAMYPAECRFNADGTIARVVGRRIVPGGADRAVIDHFRTPVAVTGETRWDDTGAPPANKTND